MKEIEPKVKWIDKIIVYIMFVLIIGVVALFLLRVFGIFFPDKI